MKRCNSDRPHRQDDHKINWLAWICSILGALLLLQSSVDAQSCPGTGNCFFANGTVGCEDSACCQTVCDLDPFCCNVEWDSLCGRLAAELCNGGGAGCAPACAGVKDNIECQFGSEPYLNRRPVGRIQRFGNEWCSAWIIAYPNLVITNEHCLAAGIDGLTVEFNYECDSCDGSGNPKMTESYAVTSVVTANPDLDYAILTVEGNPAETWGVAPVSASLPNVGDQIYEIHHGEGDVKGYGEGFVTAVDIPGDCAVSPPRAIAVNVIATGGASGSPVFDADNHRVIAICHCGPNCGPGFAIPLAYILPDAQAAIFAAGGALSLINACHQANGDMNGDLVVNGADIDVFVNMLNGGSDLSICPGDFDQNGVIDSFDVAEITNRLINSD